ncbi:MAG: EutN/CcmL family microcompartment protein [Acidobacteria bacterium]|nr:EutN/CcmL family microcompartment protein [Acidobacteriota bacterium]MBI3657326.1 EutN/CcmL family microcompartment protein [Acidobacteriota bacterium]
MIIAKVIGNVVATQKHRQLEGTKLLIVQPLGLDGNAKGDPLLAVDAVQAQAGVGDRVLVVQDGWAASYCIRQELAPVNVAAIGVIDTVEVNG